MTLILTESFRSASASISKWNVTTWNNMAGTGTDGLAGSASNQFGQRIVAASEEHATMIAGFAYQGGTNTDLARFRSDSNATTHVSVTMEADGSLKVYRGTPAGTLLGQSAAGVYSFTPASWQYIEIKVILNDTTGAVVIHVDETEVLNLSGVDTKNGGTKTVIDSFSFGTGSFDDMYVCNGAGSRNNDFLGVVRIEAYHPNGNGTTSGMTGSDGNSTDNYLLVDDAFRTGTSSADYVAGLATGDKDTYTFEDSSQPSANAVFGVMVHVLAEKTDSGARGLDAVARLSGIEADITPAATNPSVGWLANGTYGWAWACYETKPGGGDWTVADYNSAEFGQKAT